MNIAIERNVDDAALVSEALMEAGKALGLKKQDIADVVKRSRTRLNNGIPPGSSSGLLALYLVRIYRSLYALFGGDLEVIRMWMTGYDEGTGGVPIEQIKDIAGLVHVMEYLDAMRGKI